MNAIAVLLLALGTPPGDVAPACAVTGFAGPEYYAIPLAPTGTVPGTRLARARADVSFEASPFPVALTEDGSYAYTVSVGIERMKPPRHGRLVAWVTTRDLDRVERLGPLDADFQASGTVRWNKFLIVVTLEPEASTDEETWSGPIVFRGMSRSGAMHTMVGHGALQQENCAAYGFGS